jgi:uncharacterized protein YndB with AHSA1/START domain
MSSTHAKYSPGAATGASIDKHGDSWTLVLVRDFRHPQDKVWNAITDPAQLREWAPFDADRNLAAVGTAHLTTIGAPPEYAVSEGQVKRAEPPSMLEFTWGGQDIRFELKPNGAGTRLTMWHNIDRRFIAMGAAGWHICMDVLDRELSGDPIGRMVGPALMHDAGWQRLHSEYATLLGVEQPTWSGREG